MVWSNQNIILYHGTHSIALREIFLMKKFDLAKCRTDLDFGKGFYTTTNYGQAMAWARRAARRFNRGRRHGRVLARPSAIEFSLSRNAIAELETMFFIRPDDDYWSLVRHCRQSRNHARSHASFWYDGVAGPVATGDLTSVWPGYDQSSFVRVHECAATTTRRDLLVLQNLRE